MCKRKQLTEAEKRYLNLDEDKAYLIKTIDALPFGQSTKDTVYHYAVDAAKRSRRTKLFYYGFNVAIIALPVVSSLLELLPNTATNWVTVCINGLITLCASLLALFRCHDKWTRNRSYLEKMINLMFRYSGPLPEAVPEEQPVVQASDPADDEEAQPEAAPAADDPAGESDEAQQLQKLEVQFIREFTRLNAWHQGKWARERQKDDGK